MIGRRVWRYQRGN